MAYDEDLAERVRLLIDDEPELGEKKMFGGLAFLIDGNMAVTVSGKGGIMIRVDPMQSAMLAETTEAGEVEMRGRVTKGWLRVEPENLRTRRQLAKWVELGVSYTNTLPAKR